MNIKWMIFAIVFLVAGGIFALTPELRQAVAKYALFCLIAAVVIRPIGLALGNFVSRVFKKD
jgi:hypothetical protein